MGRVEINKESSLFFTQLIDCLFTATFISLNCSLRPGTKGFNCGKWIIYYNLGTDDGAESKFGTHKELIALNILKYKHSVNKAIDMSRGHFAKNLKLLTNWWPVSEKKSGNNIFLIQIKDF